MPKVAPASSTPESTGGVGSNAWKNAGDTALWQARVKESGPLL
ncbi:tail fiber/spike domain-containing protein [Pectobacterium actinidiae]